jgi:uncharacterized protein YhaN
MRISRLDLLKYGHFTDAVLELPINRPDLHIVFGPNEAGKSTALSALEDFLFGIPHNSPLNFLHDYGSMRIGAAMEDDGNKLRARRRKGNKDTLLTREEVPIPGGDGALAKFLSGADRNFFVRMFSLDHSRLRQGGREILEARDEVGQMLFSAGAGIAGLREHLKALEEEADGLWGSRRATRRKYYQADDRLKAAENALREHTVTATKWQELRRTYDAAREAYDTVEQEIEGKSVELRRLNRIRRVYRDVRRKSDIEDGIRLLGKVTLLPEDALQSLERAEREDAQAAARVETLTEQLEAVRKERAVLTCDEALLLRAEDIQHLHERRIQVRAGKADLPKRRAELASSEADLRRLAAELEWETSNIDRLLARLPARSKVASVRMLLGRRGELLSGTENARNALEEAETRLGEAVTMIAEMGNPVEVSRLAATVQATRESGDITSRIKVSEGEIKDAQAAIQQRLKSLRPEVSDEEALGSMSVPPRDTVQAHRDALRDLDQHLMTCQERISSAELQLARHLKACERVTSAERAVSPEELAKARQYRDTGWSLIRKKYIEGISFPEEHLRDFIGSGDELTDVYEAAVFAADETADRRFDKAEAAARLAEISRQTAEQKDLLTDLQTEEKMLDEKSQTLSATWGEMWQETPFLPLSPDVMLEWITARAELLGFVERRASAERLVASLHTEEMEMIDRLIKELETLGFESGALAGQPFRVVLETAADVLRRHQQEAEERRKLEEGLRRARTETERKRKALEKALSAWSEWNSRWAEALSAMGLTATAFPEAVATQVDVIDEMREIVVRINELRHERIDKIEQFITVFDRDVGEIVGALAPDLAEAEPDDAVLELERRFDEAKGIRELQKGKDATIISLEKKIEEFEGLRRGAGEVILSLQSTAGVECVDDLRSAIEKSDSLRDLQTELFRVTKALIEEGDGLSVAELHDECDLVDLDQIVVREETLEKELDLLRERLMEARVLRSEARKSFEAIGADNAAAKAAADRQAALAELKEVAERYVLTRSSALLLRWAIDRFRREKQAPLLKRAGQVFRTLTSGSFTDLTLEFDENDNVHLTGLRSKGERVAVSGMSTGTADQLYLALRVASVEDYLERATPLPFVADDLFINFDDARAAAGLEVMGQLAEKTQVLFFTHHRHLLDIARETLGPSLSVISLLQCTDDDLI